MPTINDPSPSPTPVPVKKPQNRFAQLVDEFAQDVKSYTSGEETMTTGDLFVVLNNLSDMAERSQSEWDDAQ